jgi:hypothetical protein
MTLNLLPTVTLNRMAIPVMMGLICRHSNHFVQLAMVTMLQAAKPYPQHNGCFQALISTRSNPAEFSEEFFRGLIEELARKAPVFIYHMVIYVDTNINQTYCMHSVSQKYPG